MGQNENTLSPMGRARAASRKNKRPAGVADDFQISTYIVERHLDETSNVFTAYPSGPGGSEYRSKRRPEIAVVSLARSKVRGNTEWLTGEACGCDVVRWYVGRGEFIYVSEVWNTGPAFAKVDAAERIGFGKRNRAKAARQRQAQREPAQAGA